MAFQKTVVLRDYIFSEGSRPRSFIPSCRTFLTAANSDNRGIALSIGSSETLNLAMAGPTAFASFIRCEVTFKKVIRGRQM